MVAVQYTTSRVSLNTVRIGVLVVMSSTIPNFPSFSKFGDGTLESLRRVRHENNSPEPPSKPLTKSNQGLNGDEKTSLKG